MERYHRNSIAGKIDLAKNRLGSWRLDRVYTKHSVLVKNSGALAIASVGSAILGFVYWWLAARFFPPEAIGKASAFVSLMAFIGVIGDGGLGTLLTGEVNRWPGREGGLISAAAVTALFLSLATGGVGLVVTELTSATLNPNWLDNLTLLIGCGLTGISISFDQAFVGMLQSTFPMFRLLSFSIFKLILISTAAIWLSNESVILFSWVISLMLSLMLPELFMRRLGKSLIQRPDFKLLNTLKRKTADHYMLNTGMMAPGAIMPYLVAVLLSPTSNAAFTVIWMVVSVAGVIPGAMATVLFPAIRSEPHQYRDKMLLSLGASLLYAVVFSGFIFLYSKEILTLFNPAYAEIGGEHLRLLGLGMFGAVIKFHVCAAVRLTNSMRRAALWFCAAGLFELACVAAGAWAGALEGVAIGWATAMMVDGAVMLLLVNPCGNQHALTDTLH
jgi:O-antigen/teichoic acid export membrane protein